jgi:hypothetical protein
MPHPLFPFADRTMSATVVGAAVVVTSIASGGALVPLMVALAIMNTTQDETPLAVKTWRSHFNVPADKELALPRKAVDEPTDPVLILLYHEYSQIEE